MGQTTTQQFPGQVTIQVSLIDVEEALDVLSQTHRLVVVVSLTPDGQTKTTTQDLQHLAVAPPWWRCRQNLRGRHGEILQKSTISLNLIFLLVVPKPCSNPPTSKISHPVRAGPRGPRWSKRMASRYWPCSQAWRPALEQSSTNSERSPMPSLVLWSGRTPRCFFFGPSHPRWHSKHMVRSFKTNRSL